jgi:hypothetical protein
LLLLPSPHTAISSLPCNIISVFKTKIEDVTVMKDKLQSAVFFFKNGYSIDASNSDRNTLAGTSGCKGTILKGIA